MTSIGEIFELEVKEALESELRSGRLGVMPEFTKVFHHKAYYSQRRNKQIVFDVVIEFYRPAVIAPYLIWVWECKDYKQRVPVDDVEELHAKVEQVELHRTKATVVCRNGFQESAITYAKNMGIGLVRMLPDGSLIRAQESVQSNRISERLAKLSLTQESSEVFLNSTFFGLLSSGEGVNSLSEMIRSELLLSS